MSSHKMLRRSLPLLALLGLGGAVPAAPTPATSHAAHHAAPRTAPVRHFPQLSYTPSHGPGDIIPPCVIAYGYTNRGPTGRDGHLLFTSPPPPRGVYVSRR